MVGFSRNICYYETDKMGIVHNSNYLRLFEEARLYHFRQTAMPYAELESKGIIIPQVEAHVQYINVMHYDDLFECRTKLVEYNGIRMKYEYEIRLINANTTIAVGWTRHCFLDDNTRRPINLSKRCPDLHLLMQNSMD